ncbi:MAG TPA: sulfite exporter TauE/SafE family protein [Candidatus Methylacidiphilales bacterium]|nr:sulfite exporter TauE/SafE family protein [Candidatus Methylacidiphilales bacterium]
MTFADSLLASHGALQPALTWNRAFILAVVAMAAGAINSVAGGGSFLTFPALIFCGVTPLRANTTNTVAVWFGSLASVGAYRNWLGGQRQALGALLIASLAGGLIGAFLLLKTPDATFNRLLPWLLLTATLIFIFGRHLTALLRRLVHLDINRHQNIAPFLAGSALQLVIAVYGGFFGGGIGILMLALLTLLGYEEMHVMNGLKTVLATAINGIAVVAFICAGAVDWPQAGVMIAGSVLGGYGGAVLAQRVSPQFIRYLVMATGIGMTIYFFVRQTL